MVPKLIFTELQQFKTFEEKGVKGNSPEKDLNI